MTGFRLFATAIGPCGIAWRAKALVGVQLPEGSEPQTRARMLRRFPEATEDEGPAFVQVAVRRIQSVLEGGHDSLADIPLDMDGGPEFNQRVYAVARTIPPGRVLTYGDVARALGEPGASRAVGQALGHNPFAPGAATKLKMLEIEKAQFGKEPGLFD